MMSATSHECAGSRPAGFSCDGPLIVGVDEAGRGPLAGPVVAGAVALCKSPPAGLDDSKKLTAKRRVALDEQVQGSCAWAVAIVHPEAIDRLNIFAATMLAMSLAVERLEDVCGVPVAHALIDGNMTPQGRTQVWRWPARALVGGDSLEPAISAASIVAKEWRDRLMIEAAGRFPGYGWERNKGYGTAEHLQALRTHGITPLHRRSFAPVAQQELPV